MNDITGYTITRIFETPLDGPDPIYHLPRGTFDATTICGLPAGDSRGVQLRHAVRFARLCSRCQRSAGILVTEPAEAIRHIRNVSTKGRL